MISVVHDHFQEDFNKSWPYQPPMIPAVPMPGIDAPMPDLFSKLMVPTVNITKDELEKIRALIKDFRTACEYASKLDVIMKQPDCVDPEKAKLKERVDFLEKMVDDLLARK